jgi:hypothetical protein
MVTFTVTRHSGWEAEVTADTVEIEEGGVLTFYESTHSTISSSDDLVVAYSEWSTVKREPSDES